MSVIETGDITLKKIAYMKTDFPEKFGIPRQSGLVDSKGTIIFEKEYRNADSIRGIEQYSRLWILWGFSGIKQEEWSPTVRPPRLGGNQRVGVFATRSPYRPNPIGLSGVRLDSVEISEVYGPVLHVTGPDLMDGTPIYDIKPYLPYVDSYPEESGGFAEELKGYHLDVVIPDEYADILDEEEMKVLKQILSQDPRPSYQDDPERIYGMKYAGYEIKFTVQEHTLTLCNVTDVLS